MITKEEIYNYTNRQAFLQEFPTTDERVAQICNMGECMVETGDEELNVEYFNKMMRAVEEAGYDEKTYDILCRTYLTAEVFEKIESEYPFTIVDFGEETKEWMSSNFTSENDKGLLLYEMGLISFPVEVPEELKPYMDYAALYRDAEINMGIRCVTTKDSNYLVW